MLGQKKPLLVLTAAQALCLAFGLWIQDRFIVTSANWRQPATANADEKQSPAQAPASNAQAILDAMPAARGIVFVWVAGLQSGVAYLILSRLHSDYSRTQTRSTEEALRREQDLVRTQNAVIFGLAKLAESRDPDTGQHLERIALYSTRLAQALRRHPKYRDQITPAFIKLIGVSSALHDIGKVGVADSVLLKPAQLDSDERFRMQLHAAVGGKCIREIELRLGSSNFLEMARDIAFHHHERWDGTGYPTGLAGERIPLAARIVSIADVYDALSVKRVYKEPYPHEQCVDIIRDERGRQFDPEIVDVFLTIESEFRGIARRFADAEARNEVAASDVTEKMSPDQEAILASVTRSMERISIAEPTTV